MSKQQVYTRRFILLCPVEQAGVVEEALTRATGISWAGSLTDPHHEGGPTGVAEVSAQVSAEHHRAILEALAALPPETRIRVWRGMAWGVDDEDPAVVQVDRGGEGESGKEERLTGSKAREEWAVEAARRAHPSR